MQSKIFFFSQSVSLMQALWDGLSPDSVDFSSLAKFKSSVNSRSFSNYLEFTWLV